MEWVIILFTSIVIIGIVIFFLFGIYAIWEYFERVKWKKIEMINNGLNITRETTFIDKRGYLRWKETNRLCHRDVAFNYIYKNDSNTYNKPFREYDIHHKNENKRDARPTNLEVLKREAHQIKHGQVLYIKNIKYIRLARTHKIYRETSKAIMVARCWLPLSQIIIRDGWIYLSEWLWKKKFEY